MKQINTTKVKYSKYRNSYSKYRNSYSKYRNSCSTYRNSYWKNRNSYSKYRNSYPFQPLSKISYCQTRFFFANLFQSQSLLIKKGISVCGTSQEMLLKMILVTWNTLQFVFLMVQQSVAISSSMEPKFDEQVLNVTVTERSTAVLPCSVSSLGTHEVVWTDQFSTLLTHEDRRIIDDDRLSVERPYTNDWNLHIRNVRYSDQGLYNCQINTTPVKIKMVHLAVQVPAKILEDPSSRDVRVKEGENVILVCNVTGTPQPTVTWYRHVINEKGEEKKSELCPGSDRVGVNGEVLVIHNVTRYCGDRYECVAFNTVPPAASKIIEVSVEFPPEIYLPNKRIGQSRGKETILECTVTAFPHAVTMWQKDGVKITTSSLKYRVEIYEEVKNKLTLSLRVFDIQADDYGEYTCISSNPLGDDEESMILYEYSLPSKTTTTTLPTVTAATWKHVAPTRSNVYRPPPEPPRRTQIYGKHSNQGRGNEQRYRGRPDYPGAEMSESKGRVYTPPYRKEDRGRSRNRNLSCRVSTSWMTTISIFVMTRMVYQ